MSQEYEIASRLILANNYDKAAVTADWHTLNFDTCRQRYGKLP